MKAVLAAPGGLSLAVDHPLPEPRPGESLIRVLLAGICSTDLEIARGYMGFRGIPGHEFVGMVVRSQSDHLQGERVVGEINCPCGDCGVCRSGLVRHCTQRTVLGILGRDGAFGEFLVLPDANLHVVPEQVPDEMAVFIEPIAAAWRILEQIQVVRSTRALVLGDGRLGLLVAAVLADAGLDVTVIGRHAAHEPIAERFGARWALAGTGAPLQPSNLVVEATGTPEGLSAALRLVRPCGTLVMKTTVASPHRLELAPVVVDEITVVGSRCGPFPPALDLLSSGRLDPTPLIQAVLSLDDALTAFEAADRPGVLKILVRP